MIVPRVPCPGLKNSNTALIFSHPLADGDVIIFAVTQGESIVSDCDSTCLIPVADVMTDSF